MGGSTRERREGEEAKNMLDEARKRTTIGELQITLQ